jgi:long-chain fatty acid transport protein
MSKRIQSATVASCLGVVALCGFAGDAAAAGFALREQSADGLGNAFAGETAKAYDPSTVFYNPAGMTRLNGMQAGASAAWIDPVAKFTGSNSSPLGSSTSLPGGNVGGSQADNAIKPAAIGSAYAVWGANPDWRLGLSITTPFGMRTEYKEDWVGRYQALASDLTDIEFSPTLAYRVNDQLSIGGGPRIDYIKARLTQAINYRGIATGAAQTLLGGLPPAVLAGMAPQIGALSAAIGGVGDGLGKVEGDDWGVGYTLGGLYEFDKSTRVGINYRSRVFHQISGNATFQTPASVTGLAGAVGAVFGAPAGTAVSGLIPVNQSAKAKVTLPDSLSLGLYRDITDQWAAMADVGWTHWSLFKQLNVVGASGQSISSTTENWQDTWSVSLGANYKPADKWILHGGVAYDQSPVKDQYRTARIPDADRYWLAIGATYTVVPGTDLNFAYTHIFVDNASINETSSAALATGTLTGTYENHIDIFTAGVTVRF